MLSFNPADFSYQSDNKGFDYGAQVIDEPLEDFFNQFINHEPAESGNNACDTDPFRSINFPTDEDTASSESHNNTFTETSYTNAERVQYRPQANSQLSQTSEGPRPQSYRKAARTERPKPVISGLELLNLEGKLAPSSKAPIPPSSAPAATPAFPLRRKPRFSATPETLRDRNHRVSKSPCDVEGDPTKMMRPSYYYRHEMPSYSEWTQRFEHISLQTPGTNPSMSPPLPESVYQDEASTDAQSLDHQFSGEPLAQNETSLMQNRAFEESGPVQHWASPQIAGFSPLSSPVAFQRSDTRTRHHSRVASHHASHQGRHNDLRRDKAKSQSALPQLRSASSWTRVETIPENFDYTVSPDPIQSAWFQRLPNSSRPYDETSIAAQSAPVLAPTNQDYSQSLIMQGDRFGQFINEDPSDQYLVSPTAAGFDVHSPLSSPQMDGFRPQSPSSPSSSRSPSPVTPSRSRRRSKHSRRKSSAGTLKSAKSASSVFVNYTPRDREKIVNSVAPSGSSKTKARREQEAHEKRRKMSLAVEKVVQENGGDVEKFRAAGLLGIEG